MISIDGAALIATIIPIALLVVGLEIQRVPTMYATGRGGTVGLWIVGAILVLGLVLGFLAEYLCIAAVATGAPLNVVDSRIVWAGLYFLGLGAGFLLAASLLDRLGLLERLGTKAHRRRAASPRRTARMLEYVDTHHPSSRTK
ncbi:hypothetical protein [Microbacterium caowuchunii]|uniref:Uncharacterized protein n=1 Tax=Microbacterium caowuchunii TaxID=2614638 RepID=A0A5N0TGL0_9MICO|nr:hypothetical protein [Microbacterium caowuchunii]KAA9133721.1 hypothetical protein F6B40_08180 [Microbacterium caowuchunii]